MALKGDIVKSYLKKFPDTPSRTLAKKIYKENKKVWLSADNVRGSIRYYRGQLGKKSKKEIADKRFIKGPGKANPFEDLPEPLRSMDDADYYDLSGETTLVLADVHVPYYDRNGLKIALEYGKKAGVDTVLLLGDFWDCYQASSFVKDPRKRNLQSEIDSCCQILDIINDGLGAKIIYKLGNHEERLERYLKIKAPELLDMQCLSYEDLFDAEARGIDIVRKGTILRSGALNLVHGHEFGRSMFSPVNASRGVFLRGHECCIIGHYHQSSNHTEKSMTGRIISCWSVGCLCDLRPEYKPINIKWQHGFAIVHRDGDKEFIVDNRKIIKGKVY